MSRDHPRMRGEHIGQDLGISIDGGSSPHARGTLKLSAGVHQASGIIPACAGNTVRYSFGLPDEWDHPRMRREHIDLAASSSRTAGSSPHARGTLQCIGRSRCGVGIIPACAGNTLICIAIRRNCWDHPRMRGEHSPIRFKMFSSSGSSPHARGTPFIFSPPSDENGIIPACAGNTCTCGCMIFAIRDHPRMRGEHSLMPRMKRITLGSSPHARGTLCRVLFSRVLHGIIPACAGNTCAPTRRADCNRDHPRMRGEHHRVSTRPSCSPGSSPHARGTRVVVLLLGGRSGIIPACAGNTHRGCR